MDTVVNNSSMTIIPARTGSTRSLRKARSKVEKPKKLETNMIGRAPSKKLGDGVVEAHKEFIRESATFSAYFKPENEKKNAKQDKVFLYDWNRVILTDGPDYYHASFVDGCARLAQYVMAQAPFSKETQDDFARLVQQTKPDAIFYLDKLDSDEGKFLSTSGKVTVKCDEDKSGDFHNLSFGKVKTKLFVVNSWSVDHDPPKNIVDIHEKMRKVIGWENKGHILFVCKDGVSRSGIMVLLDMESERIRSKGRMKIADTVRHIRYQRSNSFDTFELFDASTVVLTELAKRNLDK